MVFLDSDIFVSHDKTLYSLIVQMNSEKLSKQLIYQNRL